MQMEPTQPVSTSVSITNSSFPHQVQSSGLQTVYTFCTYTILNALLFCTISTIVCYRFNEWDRISLASKSGFVSGILKTQAWSDGMMAAE